MFHLFELWRSVWFRIGVIGVIGFAIAIIGSCTMFSMPGTSYDESPPPLTDHQKTARDRLTKHVETLAGTIGNRSVFEPEKLNRAKRYLTKQFSGMGYEPVEREYVVHDTTVANVEVEITGTKQPEKIVLIGAHYDTASNPGADDNASGVAGVLELPNRFQDRETERTLRFVGFVNEEPPFFQTDQMGSRVYARRAQKRGEDIVAMISLEMIGYYSNEEESQSYPFPLSLFYPSKGNFIAFVSNFSNRHLVRQTLTTFREHAKIPSEGGAPPGWIAGVGWSDHWSFWQEGYPAMMITDTAPFRNPNYHTNGDRPDTLDYKQMTQVVDALVPVVNQLARTE